MTTPTLDWTNAQAALPKLLERAHHGSPTVITKHGTPYAVLMPAPAKTHGSCMRFITMSKTLDAKPPKRLVSIR
jgi:prevent-host-death family protein